MWNVLPVTLSYLLRVNDVFTHDRCTVSLIKAMNALLCFLEGNNIVEK